jgi:hypothetical protein
VGGILEQSDATGWMAFYAMAMARIAAILARAGLRSSDLIVKFLEHFAGIRDALASQGLWDEDDGLYYDRLVTPDGTWVPVRVRSMVGLIPALAMGVVDEPTLRESLVLGKRFAALLAGGDVGTPGGTDGSGHSFGGTTAAVHGEPGRREVLLSLPGPQRLQRLIALLLDESEFLSPHGLRAVSAWHREHPYTIEVEGYRSSIDYEPAESTTPLFGGNSNWRGPIWFPMNYLLVEAIERYHRFYGDDLTIEYPTGSGQQRTLGQVVTDLQDRLIGIFTRGPDGRRACFGGVDLMDHDPAWRDNLIFSEYFNGDTGAGLGAEHQTGWTGLVADMIRRRHGAVPAEPDIADEDVADDDAAGRDVADEPAPT